MIEDIENDILHIASGNFNFRKLQDLKCLLRNCSPEIVAQLFSNRKIAEALFRMAIEISVDTIIQFGIDGEIDQLIIGGFSKCLVNVRNKISTNLKTTVRSTSKKFLKWIGISFQ